MAMWGPDLKITGVKCKRGEPITERVGVGSLIAAAVHNRRYERGLYSLAIALLPFFKPSKVISDRLEDGEALTKGADQKQYLELLKAQPVFSTLAYYCLVSRYKVGVTVRSTVDALSQSFATRVQPIEMQASGPIANITTALEKFRPEIYDDVTREYRQVTASDARDIAKELVNAALIEHAKRLNDKFNVLFLSNES